MVKRNDARADSGPVHTTQPMALLPWHGVNWQPRRDELAAVGDQDGLVQVDRMLPHIQEQKRIPTTVVADGRTFHTYCTCLTAADVLDWIRDRQSSRRLLAEMDSVLKMDASAPFAAAEKWLALAPWVRRFERWIDGHAHLGYGLGDDRDLGGLPSPFRTWATCFRDVTSRLLDHVREPHDVEVHRLLLDVDDVLAGKAVDVRTNLREVELVVRVLRRRTEHQTARRDRHPKGRKSKRPTPDAIDATATDILKTALQAAKEADSTYVPDRARIAGSASKQLGHDIIVATLFGTKATKDGPRVHRYPTFMALWKKTQVHSRDARRAREAGMS